MSNALAALNQSMTMWEDSHKLEEIRKLFAPTLTEMEFQFFVGLGKASGLNPFTREIWAIKYDKNQPAQVFIGRDGYRKAAQGHVEYDYHQSDAVYENDKFEVSNGEVKHGYTLTNRGKLVGAYCVAKRHKSSRPIYVFAELSEYSTGRSVWKDKPATMIKKVAESQCLRATFQDLLGGTYGEEEMTERANHEPRTINVEPVTKSDLLAEKLKAAKGATIEAELVEDGELLSQDQLNEIEALLSVKEFANERLVAALGYHKVDNINQLTAAKADLFIKQLNKIADKE